MSTTDVEDQIEAAVAQLHAAAATLENVRRHLITMPTHLHTEILNSIFNIYEMAEEIASLGNQLAAINDGQ